MRFKVGFSILIFCLFLFLTFDLIALSIISFSSIYVFAFFLIALTFICLLSKVGIRKTLFFQLLFIIVIASTIILYYANISSYGNSYFVGGSDDEDYDEYAMVVSHHKKYNPLEINEDLATINLELAVSGHNSPFYIYIISRIYRFMGQSEYHTIMPRILNGFCLVLSGLVIYFLVLLWGLSIKKYALLPSFLFVLNPLNLFISGHVFRDSLIALLIILAIWLYYRLNNWILTYVTFGLLLLVLSGLRFVYIIPITILFFPRLMGQYYRYLVIPFICIFLVYFFEFFDGISDLVALYNQDLIANRGNESGLTSLIFKAKYPAQLILRVLYSLITPYFLIPNSVQTAFLFCGTFFNIFLIPFAIKGFTLIRPNFNKFHLLLYAFLFYSSYTFGTFMFRHIPTFSWFLCVFGYLGLAQTNRGNIVYYLIYFFLVITIFLAINLLRI